MKYTVAHIEPRIKVKWNQQAGIYNWGADNCYPTLVERLIDASPTASQCKRVYSKFTYGRGWNAELPYRAPIGKAAVNIETPDTLLSKTADDIARYRAFAWLINYNVLGQVTSVTHVPVKWCRFGQVDSDLYAGKIVVYNNWDRELGRMVMTKDFQIFDSYNPRPEVLTEQMIAAGGIENWSGQILYKNLDETYLYPLSPIDPVIHDVDTEAQSSLIKNKKVRRGFHQSAFIRHAPFESEQDEEDFAHVIESALGADSAGGVILLEDQFNSDQPNGSVRIDEVKADVDAKGLEYTEKSISNNIRKQFNNVPPVLVDFVEGQLGNTSGESLRVAIDFYNLQTESERQVVEAAFNEVMGKFADMEPMAWSIDKMSPVERDTFEEENLKAQATLRGSVGGVQGILDIQQSVIDGATSRESGVAMLVNIYGFSETVAVQILGDVEEETDAITD